MAGLVSPAAERRKKEAPPDQRRVALICAIVLVAALVASALWLRYLKPKPIDLSQNPTGQVTGTGSPEQNPTGTAPKTPELAVIVDFSNSMPSAPGSNPGVDWHLDPDYLRPVLDSISNWVDYGRRIHVVIVACNNSASTIVDIPADDNDDMSVHGVSRLLRCAVHRPRRKVEETS